MEPPGPIPNPEVKRCRADGSWAKGPARVGRCQVFARLLRKKEPGFFLIFSSAFTLQRWGMSAKKGRVPDGRPVGCFGTDMGREQPGLLKPGLRVTVPQSRGHRRLIGF